MLLTADAGHHRTCREGGARAVADWLHSAHEWGGGAPGEERHSHCAPKMKVELLPLSSRHSLANSRFAQQVGGASWSPRPHGWLMSSAIGRERAPRATSRLYRYSCTAVASAEGK